MKVKQDMITGSVAVEYCPTHTGHTNDPFHLPIPLELKHKICAQLSDGVPIDRVLDNVRSMLSDGEIGPEQYLRRQNILRNIQRRLNSECVTKHANDLLSTAAWVEKNAKTAI